MVMVGVITTAWAAWVIPARATHGARTTADEPQYLLTALSLAEDQDLDIADEIEDRRFEAFHEITIDPQTEVLDGGREVSPHDPLLPVLLAPAMAFGDDGWILAKLTLAILAGVLAASLVWVAARRFAVEPVVAATVVAAFTLTAPLTTYATQVYPELPAALAVTGAIGFLTSSMARRHVVGLVVAITALPWLGVKYALVAAALTLVGCVVMGRADAVPAARRRSIAGFVGALLVSGAVFLIAHRVLYGGWTVYATGDHFASTGELSVVGTHADYVGRSRRVVGLVVDRSFGLAAWAPLYLVAAVALGALVRRRPPGWLALVAPLAAGWATAVWVALTMHGWWWPGRQVVVVLPCLVLATAWAAGRPGATLLRAAVVVGGVLGLLFWGWLVVEVLDGSRTLIVSFAETTDPVFRGWRWFLPDGRRGAGTDDALLVVWGAVLVGLGYLGWRTADPRGPSVGGDQDPGASELADPHVVAVDLDGDRAVRR